MSRQVHIFRSPERFLAGTIGVPGEREFFLQVVDGRRVLSVSCEKQQVAVLADRLGFADQEVGRRFGAEAGDGRGRQRGLRWTPRWTPSSGSARWGWPGTASASQVIVELLALTEEEVGEDIVLEDREDGPDALRVFLTLAEARDFARHAEPVVAAGRPPCPLCGNPLDTDGHICPRLNGYHRGALG